MTNTLARCCLGRDWVSVDDGYNFGAIRALKLRSVELRIRNTGAGSRDRCHVRWSMIRKSMPSDLIRGWIPVFPRDKREAFARRSCSNKKIERDDDSKKNHPALDALAGVPATALRIRHSLRYSGKRARISARYPSVPDRCLRRWRCASSGWFAPMAFTISL